MKIENSKKKTIILTIVTLILLLVLGLIANAIIYQTQTSEPLPSEDKPLIKTDSSSLSFIEFTQLLGDNNWEEFANLVGVDDMKLLFREDENAQILEDGSLLVENKTNDWRSYDTRPIEINSDFRILLNFYGQNKDTALTLSGQLSLPNQEWWRNIHRMYISYNKKNMEFVLYIHDGTGLEKSEHISFCHSCSPNDTLVFEFTDTQGKTLSILNTLGEIVEKIDFTQLENVSLPQGLFPKNQLFVGYNIPPYSKLSINKLFFQE